MPHASLSASTFRLDMDTRLPLDVAVALAEDFSESDLPWKVDIVDWATTSAAFRKVIEHHKVVVQKAS